MLASPSQDYYPYSYSKSWQESQNSRIGCGATGERRLRARLFVQRNQPMAEGVANEFRLVLQAESLHQGGAVILHGPLADVEPLGNLRICLPLRRQLQYLTLSRREGFVRIEVARLGLLDVCINRDFRHWRTEESSACRCRLDGADQMLFGAAFEDVTDGAVLERLGNKGTTAVHGKNHDPRARRPFAKNPQRFEPTQSRHHQVKNQDVRVQALRQADSLQAVGCDANDREIVVRFQNGLHPTANYRMIVRQNN